MFVRGSSPPASTPGSAHRPGRGSGPARRAASGCARRRRRAGRGPAGEQDAAPPVARGLHAAVGEGGGEVELCDAYALAHNAANDPLHVRRGDLPRAIEGAAVEVEQVQVRRLERDVHPAARGLEPGLQLLGVVEVHARHVSRERRRRALEREAGGLADCAAAAVAAD